MTNLRNEETKFSVSMCVYGNDNPRHFKEAMESVINQTRKPDEIVLVVDGPIPAELDETISVYEEKPFIKVIRLCQNVGHGNARKTGLENCSNDIVALMDSDDISVPDRFEKQLSCFERNAELSVVGGNIIEFIGSTDAQVGMRKVPQTDGEIKKYLQRRCPFNQVTVMFKVADVMKAGGYMDWYLDEDYYLWIRMFQNNAVFMNLDDCLVYVRVNESFYARRGGWDYFLSEAKLQLYMLHHGVVEIAGCASNLIVRFIVQVILPNGLRGIVYKKFMRNRLSD